MKLAIFLLGSGGSIIGVNIGNAWLFFSAFIVFHVGLIMVLADVWGKGTETIEKGCECCNAPLGKEAKICKECGLTFCPDCFGDDEEFCDTCVIERSRR